jgi:hypothetical protein
MHRQIGAQGASWTSLARPGTPAHRLYLVELYEKLAFFTYAGRTRDDPIKWGIDRIG